MPGSVRGHHRRLEDLAKAKGCHLLDLALSFGREQTDLEAVVLGLCSLEELNQLRELGQVPRGGRTVSGEHGLSGSPVFLTHDTGRAECGCSLFNCSQALQTLLVA